MNFLDPLDIAAPATRTPPPENANQQTLNEEVTQVISSLNRFWGGFRQQSQAALETARKDFSGVVTQAQREFNRLTTETPSEGAEAGPSRSANTEDSQPRSSVETVKAAESSSSAAEELTSNTSSSSLFTRLQSALPPNVVATVQQNIPDTLRNTDFTKLRTDLTTEFTRLQGVTRAQAEEYVHKSETLLRDAMKEAGEVLQEAGEVLRDAVKVVPPEEASSSGAGVSVFSWDGTDMWMLPPDNSGTAAGTSRQSKEEKVTSSASAVATRAEALLKRLKHEPDLLKPDPGADQGLDGAFSKWVEENVDKIENGLESEEWSAKIKSELDETEDGKALQATFDALVPQEFSKDVFWNRYFYRVHQIRQEEEKRKALLQGTVDNEEEFDWDEEGDEESTTDTSLAPSKSEGATLLPKGADASEAGSGSGAVSPQANTSAAASPRHSSDESYDLISGNVSASGEGKNGDDKVRRKPAATNNDSDDGDSDWE